MNYKLKVLSKRDHDEIYIGHTERISETDLYDINQKNWFFPWGKFFADYNQHVYKLMVNGSYEIQGLISYEYDEGFVLVNALEATPYNRIGGLSIAPPLLALASVKSFECGFEGVICIQSKFNRRLIEYYEEMGATYLGNSRLAFFELEASRLRELYLT